ncbi:MAG: single-stranded DNA-binding protein [Treponema sp.]|nr:single-stranded DNA-binding protein [Treponema sp.]
MNNLNSILIEGNLVRDPLLRSTPKGTPVCTMCLASNRFYKQDTGFEKEVSFFEVETWSRLADACYNKGRKGRGIRVVGRLKQDRWNGTDGKPHSRITIVAEHVEFRPEFKKDGSSKSAAAGTIVDSDSPYEDDYPDTENGEPVLAMVDNQLEPAVVF